MIGEPDAGKPHVRFDEGTQETGGDVPRLRPTLRPRGEETVGFVPLGLQLERVRGVGVEDGWQRFRRRQRRPGIGQSRSFQ